LQARTFIPSDTGHARDGTGVASDHTEVRMAHINPTRRIAELENQVRVLLREKRDLQEKIEELKPRRQYVTNLDEVFWREI